MKIAGEVGRLELHPETKEERHLLQGMLDESNDALLYWGDAEVEGGAFIINNTHTEKEQAKAGEVGQ